MSLSPKKILLIGGGIVVVVAILLAARSNQESTRLRQELAALQQQAQQSPQADPEEVKRLVEEVSKLIVLPEGEEPTVATITDKERLKDVPFFSKAENEDKVLIYVSARKAFLYRPSTQKLIEVATLNLNTAEQNQNFAPKVVLRNGTTTAGLTNRFETEVLKRALPKAEVVTRDNAKATTFTETIVVDITGTKKDDAQRLASAIGAKVALLPANETKPAGADFLVIIGANNAGGASPAVSPSPTQEQ